MKKLLVLLLLSLLLVSCAKEDTATPNEPDPIAPPSDATEVVTPHEIPTETPEETVYEEFEYTITARDYESIYNGLSQEEMTKEFLSAICLKDIEVLQQYMFGHTVNELKKIKADVMIDSGKTVTEYFNGTPFDGLETKVKFIVSQSNSKIFPVGVYDYILFVRKTGAFGVEYFGPAERYSAFQNAVVPEEISSPVLYNTYKFIEEYYRNIPLTSFDEALDPKVSFDSIMHLAVHTLMALGEDYVFTTTLEQFKEYISLQFGYSRRESNYYRREKPFSV